MLKFLVMVEESRIQINDTEMNVDYKALLVSLVPKLLDNYVLIQDETFSEYCRLQILELIYHTLYLPELYNFYHTNA